MLRRFTERLSRNFVFTKRLPSDFGRRPFLISPDSALAYLKPGLRGFDDLMSAAKHCVTADQCVWDIGGNLGIFSFLAAHMVGSNGTVVCVEPDPFLASLIQKSVMLKENSDRTIHVFCSAVADQTETLRFLIANRGRSSNSLEKAGHRSQAGGTRYTQFVPATTLDEMLKSFPKPDFVKIDVEGAEEIVLNGGSRLLNDVRPRLFVEVGEIQRQAVSKILQNFNYTLFDGNLIGTDDRIVKECTFNTLAVPTEQIVAKKKNAA